MEDALHGDAVRPMSRNRGGEPKEDLMQALLERRGQVRSNDSMGQVDQLPGSLLDHPVPHDATARVNP